MNERIIRGVAGSFINISLILSTWIDKNWIWLAVFVGVNLFQTAFTRFCPLELIVKYFVKKSATINDQGYIRK